MEPDNQENSRGKDGRWLPGQTGNPDGRPKGQTMKEFAREFLMKMRPEEKAEWLKGLSPEIVWRMSEGNPHNTQDTKAEVEVRGIPILDSLDHVSGNNGDKTGKGSLE